MFTPIENRLGIQPIAAMNVPNSTLQSGQSPFFNQEHPLGTIIRAFDPTYGEGEFIYLQGFSGQTVGEVVTFGGWGTIASSGGTNVAQFVAAAAPSTANLAQPLAVAMAAFPSGSPATAYGWYQIGGNAVVQTNGTLTAAAQVFLAGSGQLTSNAANGKEVLNARSVTQSGTIGGSTAAGTLAVVEIMRPFAQGQTV